MKKEDGILIEKLTSADHRQLLEYISADPEMTLFFRGDVENCGFDDPAVLFYANVKADGSYDSVILNYQNNWNVYSQSESYDAEAVAELIRSDPSRKGISGKAAVISRLAGLFAQRQARLTHMSRCSSIAHFYPAADDISIRPLTSEADVRAQVELLSTIDEFAETMDRSGSEKMIADEIKDIAKGNMNMGLFKQGRLLCAAGSTATCSNGAMIVGVATAVDSRGCGYASQAVSALVDSLHRNRKPFVCLFYNNPKAASIYHKIGFEDVGDYTMLVKKKNAE